MTLKLPPRLELARLPTPIERFLRYEQTLPDVELWVKRDDLTGFEWSGNKVRKLEFVLAEALARGCDGVTTCGGINSNHCRATAFLAARLGLETHLFLRSPDGRAPREWTGNTLLDRIVGAKIHWITPAEYRERDAMMAQHAASLEESGRRFAIIPEGASSGLGACGFVQAVEELEGQTRAAGFEFDHVFHAMGSGGTTAGLVAGRAATSASWALTGIAVCDDVDYFQRKVESIIDEMQPFGFALSSPYERFEILDQYQGDGYGLARPEELQFYSEVARHEGVVFDPCYTGKAFRGMVEEIRSGRVAPGSRVLFWHTGGGLGGFSYASEWSAALRAPEDPVR